MTIFMLDADTAIYATRRHPRISAKIVEVGSHAIGLSTLVHSQLVQGIAARANPIAEQRLIDAFVTVFSVAPYDLAASLAYRGVIAAIGFSRRDTFDRMIAAHAISRTATLVTNNRKDFASIPGLRIVNWLDD